MLEAPLRPTASLSRWQQQGVNQTIPSPRLFSCAIQKNKLTHQIRVQVSLFLFMNQDNLWKSHKMLVLFEGLSSVSKSLIMEKHQISDKTPEKSLPSLESNASKASCLPFVQASRGNTTLSPKGDCNLFYFPTILEQE